ncbi:EpsG family protein [Paenibacillus daejeonensis]|uniref:EpsG family protein n=1 Tax=Paenibacillus daejeonensis TaxID=135193 RepID=UPI00039D5E1F|nr:EpsG family protein [Paenibacillus daejeonensis]
MGLFNTKYWNKNAGTKISYLVLSLTPLFIVSGLRGSNIGTDTWNYLRGFRNIATTSFNNVFSLERWEPGYLIINKLSSIISYNEQVILIVTSFLSLAGVGYFIYKNSTNVVFSLYLFVSLYLYLFSFNGIRQAIAISIIAIGFHYIINRKLIRYIVVVALASLFHQTSILLLVLYFIYGLRANIKVLALLASVFAVVWAILDRLILVVIRNSNTLSYLESGQLFEGSGLLFPLISASILFLLVYIKFSESIRDKDLDFFIILTLLSLFNNLLSLEIALFVRFSYFFMVFYILAIPYSLRLIKKKEKRIILSYTTIILTLSYLAIRLSQGWHGVVPYQIY